MRIPSPRAPAAVLTAGLLLLAPVSPTSAQQATDTVAPGIVHREIVRSGGPWRAEVVTVRLRRPYRLEVRHAGDVDCPARAATPCAPRHGLLGRERTSELAAHVTASGDTVLAAINGDFFDLATGENENNQVVDGVLLKGVPVSDSPWDTFHNPHTQLGVGRDGRVYIDRFAFVGSVLSAGSRGALRLDGVNVVPRRGAGLVLFTAARGAAPRLPVAPKANGPKDPDAPSGPPRAASPRAGVAADSVGAVEVVLRALPGGDPWAPRYRIEGEVRPVARDSIAPGSARLVAYGAAARARLDSLRAAGGRPLQARLALEPARGPLAQVIGGWPRLVVDGRNVGAYADSLEGTFPSFSSRRHARSAIGLSKDSTTLFLVAVDGPKRAPAAIQADSAAGRTSAGMTLQELGDFMIGLGAWQAMNLDGGGSTTLVAGGRVLNQPSDPDGERKVGNALFVVRRR